MPDAQELQSAKPGKTDKRLKRNIINGYLKFSRLGKSIFELLPLGVVVFGPDLKIIDASSQTAKLIKLADTIDKSLARGTDNKIWQNWKKQLESAISTEKTRRFDRVSYTLNGKTKFLRITCTPLKKAKAARNLGGTVIIEDITEKVNIQRQLANAERLATIGKIASKVAHELNNPMDGILRYLNLTIRSIEQENLEKPKEYLTQCRHGLMRMVQIVSELLEFSRSTPASFEYVKIEQIMEDAIKTMVASAEASNVKIMSDYSSDIPQVRAGNLFQVFCNLIKNAIDAMSHGGELNISTRLTADNNAVVEFRDTGAGFTPENAEVIFEPFFTTKDKGKGTGLGLAICKDIIERHQGRITAENASMGGSIFTVYLPVGAKNI